MKARIEPTESLSFSMFDTVSRSYIVTIIVHEFCLWLIEMVIGKDAVLGFNIPIASHSFLDEFLVSLHIRTIPTSSSKIFPISFPV